MHEDVLDGGRITETEWRTLKFIAEVGGGGGGVQLSNAADYPIA
jgi:hypothetical protein